MADAIDYHEGGSVALASRFREETVPRISDMGLEEAALLHFQGCAVRFSLADLTDINPSTGSFIYIAGRNKERRNTVAEAVHNVFVDRSNYFQSRADGRAIATWRVEPEMQGDRPTREEKNTYVTDVRRALFSARRYVPAIVMLPDVDALTTTRKGKLNRYGHQVQALFHGQKRSGQIIICTMGTSQKTLPERYDSRSLNLGKHYLLRV